MRSSRYCMSSGDGSTGLNATSVMWLPMSPARPFHHDAAKRIEATAGFLVHHRTQRVGEFPGRNDCESESRVKRQVPWHVAKGCERDGCVPVGQTGTRVPPGAA